MSLILYTDKTLLEQSRDYLTPTFSLTQTNSYLWLSISSDFLLHAPLSLFQPQNTRVWFLFESSSNSGHVDSRNPPSARVPHSLPLWVNSKFHCSHLEHYFSIRVIHSAITSRVYCFPRNSRDSNSTSRDILSLELFRDPLLEIFSIFNFSKVNDRRKISRGHERLTN